MAAMFVEGPDFFFGTCTTRHCGEQSDQVLKTSSQWSWRRCDNKQMFTDWLMERVSPSQKLLWRVNVKDTCTMFYYVLCWFPAVVFYSGNPRTKKISWYCTLLHIFSKIHVHNMFNKTILNKWITDKMKYTSHSMTKPTNWPVCPAKTQISLHSAQSHILSLISLCCPHEEAMGLWQPIECRAKTLIRLHRYTSWSVFAGHTPYFAGFFGLYTIIFLNIYIRIWVIFIGYTIYRQINSNFTDIMET